MNKGVFLRNFPVSEEKEYVLAIDRIGDANIYISDSAVDKQGYTLQNMKSLWYSGSEIASEVLADVDHIRAEHCMEAWDDMMRAAMDLDEAEKEYIESCPSRKDYSGCGHCGYVSYCWA